MSQTAHKRFDNVIVRLRGARCIVSTVAGPFVVAYWPEVGAMLSEVGLHETDAASLTQPTIQESFLTELADRVPRSKIFKPAIFGFEARPEDIRSREEFRARHGFVTFVGNCSREILIGTLEVITQRVRLNGAVDVRFRRWDPLTKWPIGRERLNDVLNYLYCTKQRNGSLTFFSSLEEVPGELWDYIYHRPRVRVSWLAAGLAGCSDMAQFERYRQQSSQMDTLEHLAHIGLWPHIVLPATEANTQILSELIVVLTEATRGGTIDVVPAPFLSEPIEASPPRADEYARALLAIYRDGRIPLRTVSPQAWVAARIDAEVPLVTSAEAAGAAVAVLANGDVYPGERAVGLEAWHLGNILEDGDALRWERLDAMAEAFSNCMKPEKCQVCDWRYRCGGVDASVLMAKEQCQSERPADWQTLFQLYCQPRKALFEEGLWDSVSNTAQAHAQHPREVLDLHESGIDFMPAVRSTQYVS